MVVWVPVQLVEIPGAKVETGQEIPVAFGSVTATAVMVTLPVFFTVNVYGIEIPTEPKFAVVVAFTMVKAELATTGTVTVLELTGVAGVPLGGVPTTDAVFTILPASRSACVTVCVPLHVVETPGSNEFAAQETPATFGSLTAMALMVTLPVFFTVKVYGIAALRTETLAVVVALTMLSAGPCTAGTVTVFELRGAMAVPLGGVPTTDAVLRIEPALRSGCVTACVPVQTVEAPGASVVTGQVTPVALGSLTAIAVIVTLPVFFTVNV